MFMGKEVPASEREAAAQKQGTGDPELDRLFAVFPIKKTVDEPDLSSDSLCDAVRVDE